MERRILIIEDEERMRRLMELVLVEQGYIVKTVNDGLEGMVLWQTMKPDVVLTDLKMPRADGFEVLDFRNRLFQQVPLIILTAYGTVQSAVTAMKQGAYDYLAKPIDNEQLIEVVAKAIAETRNQGGASRVCGLQWSKMVGSSPVMKKVYKDIALIGCIRMSVLITGESGTGKELVARAIHTHSERPDSPFVRVNCAAIPRDLLESELFGHCRGAFTGAVNDRKGAFILADGGTLFLDEIGDLPLDLQPKLLHAVEEKSVTPVGATKAQTVDVKIIAATNHNLDEMIQSGLFRSDLYYRLNSFHIPLPPLRKRGKDLIELVEYFLDRFCREQGHKSLTIDAEALKLLHNYPWPGNIRELRNVLERIVLTCKNGVITSEMLPEKIKWYCTATKKKDKESFDLPAQEKQLIAAALENCGWNQSESARKLGVSRNSLRYRMKKYNISRMR
ncbi:MAG: sigma-54 dependent transcriptional regulator [Proteobacteria bacterium]|nr:sigma-54 dependent transcriptional regulator [Pseudomonadota bacterium]MBU1057700.1 sigma-54 dependent transcriptional regulator [Pseudomonadota bacterium]